MCHFVEGLWAFVHATWIVILLHSLKLVPANVHQLAQSVRLSYSLHRRTGLHALSHVCAAIYCMCRTTSGSLRTAPSPKFPSILSGAWWT